jgi:hypothetical protein
MQDIVFNGRIKDYAMIQIGIRAREDDPSKEIAGMGIIDTGSPQCYIHVGVFDEDVFVPGSGNVFADAIGRQSDSPCREMVVRLIQDGKEKEFRVPVYEKQLGDFPRGSFLMLIGGTILSQGVLVYDGRNQKWTMTFSDD